MTSWPASAAIHECCPIVVNACSGLVRPDTACSTCPVTVHLTRDLVASGLNREAIAKASRRGDLSRVRRGAYADAPGSDGRHKHVLLVQGTWPLLGDTSVLSHVSAAVLHGLPAWPDILDRVTITRSEGGHGARRTHLHVRLAAIRPREIVEIDGMLVTSLERTATDVARVLSYERAVCVLDAALRLGADKALMADLVEAAHGRWGNATARAALAFADPRAESVGESVSRVRMAQVGLPSPTLQFEVFDHLGRWVARSDFGWLDRGVVGEFDGRVKYEGPSDDVAAVVMAEKRREQAIRDAGWWIVRWGMSDLAKPDLFRRRILQAFASAPKGGS